jgi:hypothetical protein
MEEKRRRTSELFAATICRDFATTQQGRGKFFKKFASNLPRPLTRRSKLVANFLMRV